MVGIHSSPLPTPVSTGALADSAGTTFRVWAPGHAAVAVVIDDFSRTREIPLEPDLAAGAGYFSVHDTQAQPGDLYRFRLGQELLPDPCSRYQPFGVEGPSQIVAPSRYVWQASEWRRPSLCGRVIYELHVGTFTREGTFRAALRHLDYLADLGVNTIELMPLGECAGRWNWGYDGVLLFAPSHHYGTPDELREFIDAAHRRRLAVIVDVVYNHLGPCGNVLPKYAAGYFHKDAHTGWGAALNFDGEDAGPVRDFFLQNAAMWLDEYRVDGLRLDATHAIHDRSETHIVTEIAALARDRGAFTIAEDERNDAHIVTPTAYGGWGLDGVWADDFHHIVRVGLTGERIGYLANYSGDLTEWLSALSEGWLFRGQLFPSWRRPRGTPAAHLPAEKFVFCISNHDQVGNRPRGDRLHHAISPELYRAASMLLCLAPYTPLLFQGQEWAANNPFPFFTDFPGELGAKMAENRRAEFARVGMDYPPSDLEGMPDPQAEATFLRAKLDWSEPAQPAHRPILTLYRECLRIRAEHAVFQSCERSLWRVSALGENGVAIRWNHPDGKWALIVALREGMEFVPPDEAHDWSLVLYSNAERFGGAPGAGMLSPGAVLWRAAAS